MVKKEYDHLPFLKAKLPWAVLNPRTFPFPVALMLSAVPISNICFNGLELFLGYRNTYLLLDVGFADSIWRHEWSLHLDLLSNYILVINYAYIIVDSKEINGLPNCIVY